MWVDVTLPDQLKRIGLTPADITYLSFSPSTSIHSAPTNTDRADTLASIDRVVTILKKTHGRLVVHHDARDFKSLPAFPRYLD